MRSRTARLLACTLAAIVLPLHAGSKPSAGSAPADTAPCVQVRIGHDSAGRLDCLNQTLRSEVDEARPLAADLPADSQPSTRLGLPTPASVKQRMGNAFGRSLVPQRPAQTYAPMLAPSH